MNYENLAIEFLFTQVYFWNEEFEKLGCGRGPNFSRSSLVVRVNS